MRIGAACQQGSGYQIRRLSKPHLVVSTIRAFCGIALKAPVCGFIILCHAVDEVQHLHRSYICVDNKEILAFCAGQCKLGLHTPTSRDRPVTVISKFLCAEAVKLRSGESDGRSKLKGRPGQIQDLRSIQHAHARFPHLKGPPGAPTTSAKVALFPGSTS